jgi:hypothetical protein
MNLLFKNFPKLNLLEHNKYRNKKLKKKIKKKIKKKVKKKIKKKVKKNHKYYIDYKTSRYNKAIGTN